MLDCRLCGRPGHKAKHHDANPQQELGHDDCASKDIADNSQADRNIDSDTCSDFPDLKNFFVHNQKNVKIASVNINSIRNKFLPISHILSEGMLDVLFIQESKLDDSFPIAQ